MRLIDADEFEKTIDKCVMYGNTALIDKYEVLHKLRDTSTIDAVEVVRCKDCRWFGTMGCGHWDGIFKQDGDWFCADGERKE